MTTRGTPRRRPKAGRFRPWKYAEARRAATPTPADLDAARALWRRYAPPALRDLLDAKPTSGGS